MGFNGTLIEGIPKLCRWLGAQNTIVGTYGGFPCNYIFQVPFITAKSNLWSVQHIIAFRPQKQGFCPNNKIAFFWWEKCENDRNQKCYPQNRKIELNTIPDRKNALEYFQLVFLSNHLLCFKCYDYIRFQKFQNHIQSDLAYWSSIFSMGIKSWCFQCFL